MREGRGRATVERLGSSPFEANQSILRFPHDRRPEAFEIPTGSSSLGAPNC